MSWIRSIQIFRCTVATVSAVKSFVFACFPPSLAYIAPKSAWLVFWVNWMDFSGQLLLTSRLGQVFTGRWASGCMACRGLSPAGLEYRNYGGLACSVWLVDHRLHYSPSCVNEPVRDKMQCSVTFMNTGKSGLHFSVNTFTPRPVVARTSPGN